MDRRFIAYFVLLVYVAYSITARPRNCLAWAAAFACLAFFSDNVVRWAQRRP